jgi:tetratricopeptide (TPR) repeat protein
MDFGNSKAPTIWAFDQHQAGGFSQNRRKYTFELVRPRAGYDQSKRGIMTLRKICVSSAAIVAIACGSALSAPAPATDCDTYAASDLDPQRKANGVPFAKINSLLAIPACESAVRKYPNSVKLIYQLGRAYAKKSDFRSAFVQYQKAAEQGYSLAEYNLGVLYENGWGVAKDEAQAVAWYRRAAEQGFTLAQSNLGNMYRAGRGTPRDLSESLKWLRRAAEHGNIRASVAVGLMYADGEGAAKDYGEAVKWFRFAADQGDGEAQRLLGVMYEFGGGVPKSPAAAAEWYGKAAIQGDVEAQRKLAVLEADPSARQVVREKAGNAATSASIPLSQSELDAIRTRLASLWNVQRSVEHPEELRVTVRVRLSPDRRLAEPPLVISKIDSPRTKVAADAAVRAVVQSQPFTMLRDETYERWKYMDIEFDPLAMFHGGAVGSTDEGHWQSVPIPPNLDGTSYAYDKSSIADGGEWGAEVMVKVIGGDIAIRGRSLLLGFDCGNGGYRINHSLLLPIGSMMQEGYLANIACAAVRCERVRGLCPTTIR